MKLKFCLPIIKTSKAEILKIIKENKDFNFFEVWVDYIKDADDLFIKSLINALGERLIIVLRRNDGKIQRNNFARRCKIIKLLNNNQSLLDLDIKNKKELKFIRLNKFNISLICSFHDFKKTPNDRKIFQIINSMSKNKPKIIKIATFCRRKKDALRLLSILEKLKKEDRKCIVIGMGSEGLITRIFGSLWGNEMIFTPLTINEKTAPGQLTKEKLQKICNILE